MLEEQIVSIFGGFGAFVVVFICACLPIVETKVAIPLGCSTAVWGSLAMNVWASALVAFLASTLVGILIVLTLSPVLKILKKNKKFSKIAFKVEDFFESKLRGKKDSKVKAFWFLITFIALPMPLLGIYSGAGLCVFLKLKWWQSLIAVVVGNLINCILVALICVLLYEFIPLILTIFVILIILATLWKIIDAIYGRCLKKSHKTIQ